MISRVERSSVTAVPKGWMPAELKDRVYAILEKQDRDLTGMAELFIDRNSDKSGLTRCSTTSAGKQMS